MVRNQIDITDISRQSPVLTVKPFIKCFLGNSQFCANFYTFNYTIGAKMIHRPFT